MKGVLWRLALVVIVGGTSLVWSSPPASAQPTITFEDGCGFVRVRGQGSAEISRNGTIETFVFAGPEVEWTNDFGAAPGDEFDVELVDEGAPPVDSHVYQPPAGCDAPLVTFTAENGCNDTMLIHANNVGSAPVTDIRIHVLDDLGSNVTPMLFPVGQSTTPVALVGPPGRVQLLRDTQLPDSEDPETLIWVNSPYTAPEGCDDGSITPAFTDGCDSVSIDVTSSITPPQVVFTVRNIGADDERGELAESHVVTAATAAQRELPAATGDVFTVYLVTGDVLADVDRLRQGGRLGEQPGTVPPGLTEVGSHRYAQPASCAGSGGSLPDGGPLANTGSWTGLAAAGALVLLAVGATLLVLGRRRRLRFTATSD